MKTHREPLRVLIAIDFGQTGSGYAYAFLEDKEQLLYYTGIWPDQRKIHHKTRTAVLCDRNGLLNWGYSAIVQTASLLKAGKKKGYYCVWDFKLDLHNGKPSPEGPLCLRGKSGPSGLGFPLCK